MIGIFDSGSGGLSVFREIYKLLPKEHYIFFSDNANCPYGDKTVAFIQKRCQAITDFLIGKGANIIVVACNTATGAAINRLRSNYNIKFIGMEPAVKPAALTTKSGIIGVMATAGTLKGSKYLTNKEKYEDNVKIVESVGNGWVELVEKGLLEGPYAEETVAKSLKPLLEAGADNIVLGCTHYPFLYNTIKKIAGENVSIIDPAPAVAKHLLYVMAQEGLLEEEQAAKSDNILPHSEPDIELFTSGDALALMRIFKMIFPYSKTIVRKINTSI